MFKNKTIKKGKERKGDRSYYVILFNFTRFKILCIAANVCFIHSSQSLNTNNEYIRCEVGIKVVIHVEMPKAAPQNVHLSFSKTRDDIEMK